MFVYVGIYIIYMNVEKIRSNRSSAKTGKSLLPRALAKIILKYISIHISIHVRRNNENSGVNYASVGSNTFT